MKAKYKIGTLVELNGGTFTKVNAIIISENGVNYSGANVDNFGEGDVTQAYRPLTARAPRGSKKGLTARSKGNGRKNLANGLGTTETSVQA